MEPLKRMHQDPNLYQQLDFALTQLSQFYNENCFDFPDKRLYLAEAKQQFLIEALAEYVRANNTQARMQTELDLQAKERLTQQLREAKEDARIENQRVEAQWRATLLEKSEAESACQILKDTLNHFKT